MLPIKGTNDFSLENAPSSAFADKAKQGTESPQEPTDIGMPGSLAKQLASSSSRVNALIEKMTTISSPIITTPHQSRPSLGEFQAAVMRAQLDGAERASDANSDEAALLKGKVPPWGSSHATSSEGIAVEGKTSPGTERNVRISKSKSPGKAEASTKNESEDKVQDCLCMTG